MNYRHAYHAGNFADVAKHLALVAVIRHLLKKDTPFAVIDSHAGRGRYALSSDEALKTREAEGGIERIRTLSGSSLLEFYLRLVNEEGESAYPGSPLIAARMLRPQDRLVAVEKHGEEARALKGLLKPWRKAKVEEADFYARLAALLPPRERRGLVLIDPPFEAADEFEALAGAVERAFRRFANGIYLVWYPIKADSRAFEGEVAMAASKALKIEVAVAAEPGKLSRAGLLVLNPPHRFDAEMSETLGLVTPSLKAESAVTWLAGKD